LILPLSKLLLIFMKKPLIWISPSAF